MMQPGNEADKKVEIGFMVPAPSANMPPQPAPQLPPGFSQPQPQHRPMYQAGPQMANNMGQPQNVMVHYSQGVSYGYQQPTAVVYTIQQQVEPPCCGTLGVCISDLVLFIAPTILSLSSGSSGSLTPIIILGFLQFALPISGIVCSCGELSSGKATFLQCYKWYRLGIANILLIGTPFLLIISMILMTRSDGNGDYSSENNALAMDIGSIIFFIGFLFGITGIVMASTFCCYSSDLTIRVQKMALKMQAGFQAQLQAGPVIVAN